MQKELEVIILVSQLSVQNLWSHHHCSKYYSILNTFFDMERFVVVNHRWQSKNTDGSTDVSTSSIYLSDCLFDYSRTD